MTQEMVFFVSVLTPVFFQFRMVNRRSTVLMLTEKLFTNSISSKKYCGEDSGHMKQVGTTVKSISIAVVFVGSNFTTCAQYLSVSADKRMTITIHCTKQNQPFHFHFFFHLFYDYKH